MSIIYKSLTNLMVEEVNAAGEVSGQQIECAKKIIRAFDSEYPKTNYVVIKGQTQSGKTGVLFGLVNIINKLHLKEALNLKSVIYITADNSKGLVKQQYLRSENGLMDFNDDDIKITFLKRSDFKHYKNEVDSIDDSIIFIDESHFGTTKKENLLPQFLDYYGIDYLKNTNLEGHNIRIISNSATPYSELESDRVQSKINILLEPGEGYIGIKDFAENGSVVPLKNNVLSRRLVGTALPKLLKDVHGYLREIEINTGKVKCAIFRACGKNDLSNLHKYGDEYFDIYEFDTSKGSALDYNSLWNEVDVYCGMSKGRTAGKYLMVVVKDALRMGMSIREKEDRNETKNRIAVLYDYPSDKDNPQVTEQGLLGRMCGYRNNGDEEWKDIRFYLSDSHFASLKNFYENGIMNEDGRFNKMTNVRMSVRNEIIKDITGMVSEYDVVKKGLVVDKDKVYKIDVSDNPDDWFYYTYDATEYFMSKVGTTFGGVENFQLSSLKTYHNFTDNFVKAFLITKDPRYGSDNYVQKGSRRCGEDVGVNQVAFIEELKNKDAKMHISSSAYPFKNEDLGKFAWQALLNMDEMNDPVEPKIYVHVKVAQMVPVVEREDVEVKGGVRESVTMITE